MNKFAKSAVLYTTACFVGAACLFVSDKTISDTATLAITSAEARIGRPLTPLSYAGVARRTTRRAVAVGAAATSRCVQVVDAYGRVITRCY